MKKTLILSLVCGVSAVFSVQAAETVLDNYIADIEEAATARVSARDLLLKRSAPLQINMQKTEEKTEEISAPIEEKQTAEDRFEAEETGEISEQKAEIAAQEAAEEAKEELAEAEMPVKEEAENAGKKEDMEKKEAAEDANVRYVAAPFDMFWGINLENMQKLGWQADKLNREGYENVFAMENEAYPHTSFETVAAIFGRNDKLWCIYAEGRPIDDTPQAAKILELYGKYYEALEKKYGNAEIHFEPYTYEKQTMITQNGRPAVQTETVQNPAGGDTFLQELQEGKARLYSTFHNNDVGVTLAVYVDENGKSRLMIEYKNLPLMDQEMLPTQPQTMEGL